MRLTALLLTGLMLIATVAMWIGHASTGSALLPTAPSSRPLTSAASILSSSGH